MPLMKTLAIIAALSAASPGLPEKLHCKFVVAWFCYSNGECNNMKMAARYGSQRAVINFHRGTMVVYDGDFITRNKIDNLVLDNNGHLVAHWKFHNKDGSIWFDRLSKTPEGFQLESGFSNSLNNSVPDDGNWVVYKCPSRLGLGSAKVAQ
ncbi:MAG: hypothetical protein ABI240_16140 [Sphingomonas sp.]